MLTKVAGPVWSDFAMRSVRFVLLFVMFSPLFACNGTLYTVLNPDLSTEQGKQKTVEGVIAYQIVNVVELSKTTALVDKNKIILGKAPRACTPKLHYKLATRADYSKPYIIKYDAGLFETNSFGVTLDNGVLTAVNTSSDSSKAATSTSTLLPFVTAPKTTKLLPAGVPFCNEQEVLVGIFKAPKIKEFKEIPNH